MLYLLIFYYAVHLGLPAPAQADAARRQKRNAAYVKFNFKIIANVEKIKKLVSADAAQKKSRQKKT